MKKRNAKASSWTSGLRTAFELPAALANGAQTPPRGPAPLAGGGRVGWEGTGHLSFLGTPSLILTCSLG